MKDQEHSLEAYKEELFLQFGRLGRALSSPRRLELLDLLCQAERTVEDLIRHTGLSASNVSQHLSVLKDARLVASRKNGLFVHYRLADPQVGDLWQSFRAVAMNRMAEAREVVKAYAEERDSETPVSMTEVRTRLERGDAVLLDVRPQVEFGAGHLPGAHSIPLVELEKRIDELPRDRDVIAYCRGHYCLMAHEAVRVLRKHGFRAWRTEDGVLEWRAEGYPIEESLPRA